jgi:hypothetical protein
VTDIYQKFGTGSFAVAQHKLARGEVLGGAEFAQVLRANPAWLSRRPSPITWPAGSRAR